MTNLTDYLIVDTNALIKLGSHLESMAKNLVTTPEILAEWKTKNAELDFIVAIPKSEYLERLKKEALKSGDWSVLSQQDWTLCALALEYSELYARKSQRKLVSMLTTEERLLFDESHLERKRVTLKPTIVECITNDFAMQNVLKLLGVGYTHTSGMGITATRIMMLRCYTCFNLEKDSDRQFCDSCGHATLTRVTVSKENNVVTKVHLKENWQWRNKGAIHPVEIGQAFKITGNNNHHRAHPHSKVFLQTYKNYIGRSEDDPIYIKQKSNFEKANEKILQREDFFLDEEFNDKFMFMNKPKVQAYKETNEAKRRLHRNKRH